jgi:hypothetical protein
MFNGTPVGSLTLKGTGGRDPAQPMTTRQLNRACHAAAQK